MQAANDGQLRSEFAQWKAHYDKPSADFKQWMKALKRIVEVNSDPSLTYWTTPNAHAATPWCAAGLSGG